MTTGDQAPNPVGNDWNPLDPSVLADQRQAYDEMRERCPVAHSEFMGWSLFAWDDGDRVLSHDLTAPVAAQVLVSVHLMATSGP